MSDNVQDPKLFGVSFQGKRKDFIHIQLCREKPLNKNHSDLNIQQIIEQNKEKLKGK